MTAGFPAARNSATFSGLNERAASPVYRNGLFSAFAASRKAESSSVVSNA